MIGKVVKLCMDQQGTHVMQKYVKAFPEEKREFVIDELLENEIVVKVSKNSYGLAVMKKVIKFTENFEDRRRLMKVIGKYAEILVQDPYGNYVLQESLDNWFNTDLELHEDPENCFFASVFQTITGKIEKLSVQKFSSNVIEKCLERANEYYRKIFITEILDGESVVIMKNSYGNYVFQKALALATGIDKFKIIDIIFKNFPTIKDQKIKMKWIKLLKKNLKQEDVIIADQEQDSLDLPIDSMINYSHKFKLINDELSRFDPNQSNNKKLKNKKGKNQNFSAPKGNYGEGFSTNNTYGGMGQNMVVGGNNPGMYKTYEYAQNAPTATHGYDYMVNSYHMMGPGSMPPPPPPPKMSSYSYTPQVNQMPMMNEGYPSKSGYNHQH